MTAVRNILPAALITIAAVGAAVCNGFYTSAPSRLQSALHPVKPRGSNVYHGESYRYPENACGQPQCHGADLTGGNSGSPSCWKCHGDVWMIFKTHTLVINGFFHNAIVDTATQRAELFALCGGGECHDSGLTGVAGLSPSCFSCHNPIPMPGHRVDYDGIWHKIGVADGGTDNSTCAVAGCHGDPSPQGPYCSSCHTGSTHSLTISGANHNPLVDTVTWNTELPPLCGNSWCHGAALIGGTGRAPSCLKCHSPIPTPGHRVNYEGHWHRIGVQEGTANAGCSVVGCHGGTTHKGPYCTQCHDSSAGG